MQCNFTLYLFASSSLPLPKIVMKYFFDFFRKPISPFSEFCFICVLGFYFVYCINCVLNEVDGAWYCNCSLVALRVPEICFWAAKTRENLNFSRCIHVSDLVLKFCSDINEGNWLQFLFLLLFVDGYSCLGYWNEFFSTVFRVLG